MGLTERILIAISCVILAALFSVIDCNYPAIYLLLGIITGWNGYAAIYGERA